MPYITHQPAPRYRHYLIIIKIKLLFKKDTLTNCEILEKYVSSKKRASLIEKYCCGLLLQYRDYDCALLYFEHTLAVIS